MNWGLQPVDCYRHFGPIYRNMSKDFRSQDMSKDFRPQDMSKDFEPQDMSKDFKT